MSKEVSNDDVQMGNKHTERATSLSFRRQQTKSTLRSHLSPARTTVISKTITNTSQEEEKGSITLCWWGHKLGLAIIEINIEIPESLKIDLSYDLDILFLGSYQNTKLT